MTQSIFRSIFSLLESNLPTKREELKARFCDNRLQTKILLLHPDYRFIEAVANMDVHKAGSPDKQKSDCKFAIRLLQELRAEIQQEREEDIRDRVQLYGYHLVPTWAGFVGRSGASISMFFTRPHFRSWE
jgi:hypothetical protein